VAFGGEPNWRVRASSDTTWGLAVLGRTTSSGWRPEDGRDCRHHEAAVDDADGARSRRV
jgi:hypothetical protein